MDLNTLGHPVMLTTMLIFAFLPSKVSPQLHPFSVPDNLQEGDRLSLTCSVSKGATPLNFEWSFNGSSVAPHHSGLRVVRVDDFTSLLTIERLVAATHAEAKFACAAENAAGRAEYDRVLVINGKFCVCFSSPRDCVHLARRPPRGHPHEAAVRTGEGRRPGQLSLAQGRRGCPILVLVVIVVLAG